MILVLSTIALLLSLLPAAMFLRNAPLFRVDLGVVDDTGDRPEVSVLIPARDEAAGIACCLDSVLQNQGAVLEVIVLDDHSTDETNRIVVQIAAKDDRLRCVPSKDLPPNWNGKQFACYQLSKLAKYEHLVFLDADVRLSAKALRRT